MSISQKFFKTWKNPDKLALRTLNYISNSISRSQKTPRYHYLKSVDQLSLYQYPPLFTHKILKKSRRLSKTIHTLHISDLHPKVSLKLGTLLNLKTLKLEPKRSWIMQTILRKAQNIKNIESMPITVSLLSQVIKQKKLQFITIIQEKASSLQNDRIKPLLDKLGELKTLRGIELKMY